MKTTHYLLTTLFLASFLQISFAFSCSDLAEKQCLQLQKDGCIWSGSTCTGSYSPSCIPPSCYYVDSNSRSTAAPDGTPGKPFKTLSDGFMGISGKNGFLIIMNVLANASADVIQSSTLTSNITIKPLFEDQLYTIDFTKYLSFFGTALIVKNPLKIIGANLGLNFTGGVGGVSVFSVRTGAELFLENVGIHNTSGSEYTIALVRSTESKISMVNCRFSSATASVQMLSAGTLLWKNVTGSGLNLLRITLSPAAKMTMKHCFFTGGLQGAFMSASAGSELLIKNCTFRNLVDCPQFLMNSAAKMTMEDCAFENIFANSLKFFTFFRERNLYGFPSVIRNTSFTNISVQISLFSLEGKTVDLSLINVTMKNMTKQTGIFVSGPTTANQFAVPAGICCSSIRGATLSVESSNFSEIGSCCIGLRDTYFTLKSSVFDNSGLLGTESASIVRKDADKNQGVSWIIIEGTGYYYEGSEKIFIQDSKFIKNGILPRYGGAIQLTGIKPSDVRIARSEFIGNGAYYGGAIYSENVFVANIQFENNLFVDNYAYNGGAIYKLDKSSGGSFSINNTQFIGNKAVKNGGALYLYRDSVKMSNTEFISNAAVNGGALYYINLENNGGMSNVSFIQNSASNAGGAMKLFFRYTELKTEAVIFENNFDFRKQAINQGRPSYFLLSFYDLKMRDELMKNANLEDLVKNPKLTRLNFTVNTSQENAAKFTEMKHKSGNELAQILRVQVFDSENKVADYIQDEEIVLDMIAGQNNKSNYTASLVSSPLKFKLSNGQFFAKTAIKMHGEPTTTATLQLKNVQGSSDFIQDSSIVKPFNLQVRFIDCEEGDIFERLTRSCLTCAPGSYSFENPYRASHCYQCPKRIKCFGGNQVAPKTGYWIGNYNSLMALKCPNPSACLGGSVDHEYFLQGKCQYPHQGNLCNQCAPKFAKFGSSTKCEDCRNNIEYYSKLILFLVLQVAVILGLFKLNEKQDRSNTFNLNTIKILISFIQINSIIINYDLEWLKVSKDFIHVINSFVPVNHDGFPIDCLISLALPDNHNLIFVKLIVTSFQPFIIWGLSILAYFLILSCSSRREALRNKLKNALGSLFFITAFLVQPNVILTCLDLFSCQHLSFADDAGYFLTSYSEVKCWTGSHLIWSLGIALPLLLVWAVLLPAILFFKTKKFAKLPGWQPFFYQGLEKKRFYWKFIMLFFKTLVIILFTILSIIHTEIQVLGTFFVCIVLTALFVKLRPYSDSRLHGLGLFSLVTLTLASYIGFFSSTDNWMGIQMTICSVVLVVTNIGLFTLPAFYKIKDFVQGKRSAMNQGTIETQHQPQTEAEKLTRTEEEQPKQTTNADVERDEEAVRKGKNEDLEVCTELNKEMKVGKIVRHAAKESIDNFSIMQSSGSGLLSPLQSSSSFTPRLLSPLCSSPTLARQVILSSTSKENMEVKGDSVQQKPIKRKRIDTTRINMKQFVVNELEEKNMETEKTVAVTETETMTGTGTGTGTGTTRSEIPSVRTQGELDNLLATPKLNKVDSKNKKEEMSTNL